MQATLELRRFLLALAYAACAAMSAPSAWAAPDLAAIEAVVRSADAQDRKGESRKALATLATLPVPIEEISDQALQAYAWRTMGNAKMASRDAAGAQKAMQNAVRAAEQSGSDWQIYASEAALATALASADLRESAEPHYERAVDAFERIPETELTPASWSAFARTLFNRASQKLARREFAEAEPLMALALRIAEKNSTNFDVGNTLIGYAEVMSALERHSEALAAFERARALEADLGWANNRAFLYIIGSRVLRRAGSLRQSLEAADKAVVIASKEPVGPRALTSALRERARALSALGDHAAAEAALESAIDATTNAYKAEQAARLAELEAEFDAESRELAIARLDKEAAERELQINRQNYAIGGGGAALGVVGLFALFGWRSARRQAAQAKLLAERADEIERQRAALEKAFNERGVMIAEIDHRVRANLHTIGAMIALQVRRLDSADFEPKRALGALREIEARLNTMARLQASLARLDAVDAVDMQLLLTQIVEGAADLFATPCEIGLNIDAVVCSPRLASPIALVACELVSNALEHGDLRRDDVLEVVLSPTETALCLTVRDTGVGMRTPEDADQSLGLKIVRSLIEPIGGSAMCSNSRPDAERPGACWRVMFPSSFSDAVTGQTLHAAG